MLLVHVCQQRDCLHVYVIIVVSHYNYIRAETNVYFWYSHSCCFKWTNIRCVARIVSKCIIANDWLKVNHYSLHMWPHSHTCRVMVDFLLFLSHFCCLQAAIDYPQINNIIDLTVRMSKDVYKFVFPMTIYRLVSNIRMLIFVFEYFNNESTNIRIRII